MNNNYINRCNDNVLSSSTFSYLNGGDLAACCSVSIRWRALASQDKVWERVAKQLFGHALNFPNYRAFLRECASEKLNRDGEIVLHIESFVNRIEIGQNARFRCIIGSGQNFQTLEVVIKSNRDQLPRQVNCDYHVADLDFTEDYIATRGFKDLRSFAALHFVHRMGGNSCIVRYPRTGNFVGIVRFPDQIRPDMPMASRIQEIIGRRLTQFDVLK